MAGMKKMKTTAKQIAKTARRPSTADQSRIPWLGEMPAAGTRCGTARTAAIAAASKPALITGADACRRFRGRAS